MPGSRTALAEDSATLKSVDDEVIDPNEYKGGAAPELAQSKRAMGPLRPGEEVRPSRPSRPSRRTEGLSAMLSADHGDRLAG